MSTTPDEFYIISLKHTSAKDKFFTLWRPENRGYVLAIQEAGKYRDLKDGYHNNEGALPIKTSGMYSQAIGDEGALCLVNDRAARKQLGILVKNGNLIKG